MYIINMYILNDKIFLVLVLIVLIFLLILYKNKREFFTDYFIDTEKSKNIMANEDYFDFFNENDFKLRNCSNKKDCINNYYENTIEFTQEEKKKIKKISSRIPK